MDELVKRLREHNGWALNETLDQAADAIEELIGFVQEAERDRDEYRERLDNANELMQKRWIPVTERLPEVRTWVLCYCRANSFDVFRMTDEGNWQYGNRSIYMKGYVTHWMPLPPAPKEET
mgnify:CR=1 FL=1